MQNEPKDQENPIQTFPPSLFELRWALPTGHSLTSRIFGPALFSFMECESAILIVLIKDGLKWKQLCTVTLWMS
ncbi:MAG: hypothetical protein CL663_06085 [Bacteroidetes bacterium]|nr:hypothetical protein [Bacteroidota bacterium]